MSLVAFDRVNAATHFPNNRSCSICLDDVDEGGVAHKNPGRKRYFHLFHEHCLLPALRIKPLCPLCNREVSRVDGDAIRVQEDAAIPRHFARNVYHAAFLDALAGFGLAVGSVHWHTALNARRPWAHNEMGSHVCLMSWMYGLFACISLIGARAAGRLDADFYYSRVSLTLRTALFVLLFGSFSFSDWINPQAAFGSQSYKDVIFERNCIFLGTIMVKAVIEFVLGPRNIP